MPREIRPIRVVGQVAYVPLTRGYEAIIDVADVPLVSGYNWHAKVDRRKDGEIRAVYAIRSVPAPSGPCRQSQMMMHRAILGTPDGFETDHEDGNGLNNRRSNLRPATMEQNAYNKRAHCNNTSGVKGVSWHSGTKKWLAQIRVDGRRRYLGVFADLGEAASAYAAASEKLHGEFGRLE